MGKQGCPYWKLTLKEGFSLLCAGYAGSNTEWKKCNLAEEFFIVECHHATFIYKCKDVYLMADKVNEVFRAIRSNKNHIMVSILGSQTGFLLDDHRPIDVVRALKTKNISLDPACYK